MPTPPPHLPAWSRASSALSERTMTLMRLVGGGASRREGLGQGPVTDSQPHTEGPQQLGT